MFFCEARESKGLNAFIQGVNSHQITQGFYNHVFSPRKTNMNSIGKATALVFTVMASSLTASSITYNLSNLTSTDGATVTGTITYDTVLATVTAASLDVTDAALGITSLTLLNNVAYYNNVGGTVFQIAILQPGNSFCPDCIALDTTTPLGADTIMIDPSISPNGGYGSIEGPSPDQDRITGGTLVASSTVPEPSTALIVFLGVTGLIGRNRYRKYRRAKP